MRSWSRVEPRRVNISPLGAADQHKLDAVRPLDGGIPLRSMVGGCVRVLAAVGGGLLQAGGGCCGEVTPSSLCFINKASGERSGGPGGAVRSSVEVLPAAHLARVRSPVVSGVFGRQIKLLGRIDAAHKQPANRDQTGGGAALARLYRIISTGGPSGGVC